MGLSPILFGFGVLAAFGWVITIGIVQHVRERRKRARRLARPPGHFVFAKIMDTIGPMERGEKYERPLDRDLEAQGLGMVMAKRWGLKKKLRSYNGELADEVHEFFNATQGEYRLKKILLRDGRVIEVCFQW